MNFESWLKIGRENGWVSDPTCAVHVHFYDFLTDANKRLYDAGGDPCLDALFLVGEIND